MKKKVKDHLGNDFPSIKAMYEAWGIDEGTYYYRIRTGRTLEEALTGKGCEPPRGRREASCKPVKDHLGNEFSSEKEMCEEWNIDYDNYRRRISTGWDMQKALEAPVNRYKKTHNRTHKSSSSPKHRKKYCVDHLGNIFNTEKEMCAAWNISWYTYRSRIIAGWVKEDALTTPVNIKNRNRRE